VEAITPSPATAITVTTTKMRRFRSQSASAAAFRCLASSITARPTLRSYSAHSSCSPMKLPSKNGRTLLAKSKLAVCSWDAGPGKPALTQLAGRLPGVWISDGAGRPTSPTGSGRIREKDRGDAYIEAPPSEHVCGTCKVLEFLDRKP
jgi:hypothetical protein